MLYLFITLLMVACVIAFRNWRWGVLAMIVVALIQDPMRKLVPGVPGMMAMSSIPIWFAIMAGAFQSNALQVRAFLSTFPKWGQSLQWFAVYLAVPAILSITYGQGTWKIAVLGGLVYVCVFFAIQLGWQFPLKDRDVSRVLAFYALAGSVLLIGGPLEYLGWNQRMAIIGTEALDHIWVTYRMGTPVNMLSGFFRSPDIMGWHAIMVFMISLMLAIRTKGAWRYFWIGIAIWAAANVWLCGRRKMISMIPIFFGVYLLLIYRFQQMRRLVPILALLCIAIGIGWQVISHYFYSDALERFYRTVLDEADQQFYAHVVRSVQATIQQAGFFGYGLGMAQQGIHHIEAELPRIWQESGPSKLVAELGVPGSVLFLLMLFRLGRTAYAVIRYSAHHAGLYVSAGLFALVIANGMSSLISAQVYGDAFVIIWLALLVGLLLSAEGWERRSRQEPDG